MTVNLQPVLDRPYDDAPRQAYADALDVQRAGDPQAEWIRLQIWLADNEFAADDEPDDRKAEALRRRQWLAKDRRHRELLEQQFEARTSSLTSLVPQCECEVRRGFVMGVKLPARAFLAHGAELLRNAPIVFVTFTELDGQLAELLQMPEIRRLRALSFDDCGMHDDAVAVLADSHNLAELWWLGLRRNQIAMPGVQSLARARSRLPKLHYVGLEGNQVNPCESYGEDWGRITDVHLPQEGRDLEQEHGELPWLHIHTEDATAYPPSPFRPPAVS